MSRESYVNARIDWHAALNAIVKMVNEGKATDFCAHDADRLEVAASGIRTMLADYTKKQVTA